MTRHKYPKWLSLHPLLVIAGAATVSVIYYFVGGRVFYVVTYILSVLACVYLLLRQMLYPWAIQVIEWFKKRKKK